MATALPPGAKVIPLNEPTQPVRRTKETLSRASPALTKARVQYLLPETTALAHTRVQELKRLYRTPLPQLKQAHDAAMAAVVKPLRLTKSVRNVKIVDHSTTKGGGSVVGSLCMPFTTCCALPMTSNTGAAASLVVTGAVDGLVTVWDVNTCAPLASASSCEGNQWGRVRSLAPVPTHVTSNTTSDAHGEDRRLFFSATMFDRRIGVWALEKRGDTDTTGAWSLTRLDGAASEASEEERANRHIAGLNQLAVDPTGTLLASTSDDATLRLWDVRSLTEVVTARTTTTEPGQIPISLSHLCSQDGYEDVGAVLGVAFHPDGSLVTTSDAGGRLVTWDTRTGRHAFTTVASPAAAKRHSLPGTGSLHHTSVSWGAHLSRATCLAWSPCGVRLASGGADTVIQLWDARMLYKEHNNTSTGGSGGGGNSLSSSGVTAAPFQLLGHEDVVTSLSFYTDPFVSASVARHRADSILPLALVSTSLDGTVKLWDMNTGLCVRTLDTGAPVYHHCRPHVAAATRLGTDGTAETANTAAALLTVGHTKYWSLYDIPADPEQHVVAVTETETLVGTTRGGQATGGGGGAVGASGADHSDDAEEDDDEEEEDEMAALMAKKTQAAAPPPPPPATNLQPLAEENNDDDDDDDDDEMEMLKKKAKKG